MKIAWAVKVRGTPMFKVVQKLMSVKKALNHRVAKRKTSHLLEDQIS